MRRGPFFPILDCEARREFMDRGSWSASVRARGPAGSGTSAPCLSAAGQLAIRVTHRTTTVLRAIEAQPGASNREVMRLAGPIDEGQLSKLLCRLYERGSIELKQALQKCRSKHAHQQRVACEHAARRTYATTKRTSKRTTGKHTNSTRGSRP